MMARKKTTRKNHGIIAIHLDGFWNPTKGHPEYRGSLKLGTDELDVSLWVKQRHPGSPIPMRMTGEVTLKPR
jgi:hypothetical protein